MASDDTTTIHSSVQDEDFDYDIEDGYDLYRHPHPHNMSRLSVCTSSTTCGFEDNDDVGDVNDDMAMHVSRLSIESFEAGDGDDADGELSDVGKHPHTADVSSNSDNESNGCYSLPAAGAVEKSQVAAKEYASENEAQKKKKKRKNRNRSRRRNINMNMNMWMSMERGEQFSHGESDGVKVITRPKGGRRSLDLGKLKLAETKGLICAVFGGRGRGGRKGWWREKEWGRGDGGRIWRR